jgi:hypothetical protein
MLHHRHQSRYRRSSNGSLCRKAIATLVILLVILSAWIFSAFHVLVAH